MIYSINGRLSHKNLRPVLQNQTGLVGERQVGGRNLFSNKNGFEKAFLISILTTFIGILLPWVDASNGNISGIETFYGIVIFTLLLVSLGIFYFTRKKWKLVSISLVVIGILSFLLVLRTFTELSYGINPLTGIFVDYGIGGYITALGSIGIVIAGIVGLKGKK